jgi:hypothetical protein
LLQEIFVFNRLKRRPVVAHDLLRQTITLGLANNTLDSVFDGDSNNTITKYEVPKMTILY